MAYSLLQFSQASQRVVLAYVSDAVAVPYVVVVRFFGAYFLYSYAFTRFAYYLVSALVSEAKKRIVGLKIFNRKSFRKRK